MRVVEIHQQPSEEVVEIVCDRCGAKENTKDMTGTDVASFQHTFGYLSKRDTDKINFDLCENCLIEILDKSGVKYSYIEYGSCYEPGDKDIEDGG